MARGISLLLAGVLSLIGLVVPFLLGAQATELNQMVLLGLILGISGAFYYGFGFRTRSKWLARIVSPILTWPVMLLSFGALLLLR